MRDRPWAFADRLIPKRTPRGGDIVISCIGRPPLVYCISVSPAGAGVTYSDYEGALQDARQLATRARVDVWVAEEDDVILVARHRLNVDGERGERG